MHNFSDALKQTEGLCFPLGETERGEIMYADLADISHLLVAGASGTGKSVFINSLLLSLISNNGPENLRLILCDTKIVEFSAFNGIRHLLFPVCANANLIYGALQWAANETEKRLRDFSTAGKKSLSTYNDYTWEEFVSDTGLPQIVVVVDDFASALLEQPEMANSIRTILLNGRTTGVHLIFSSQTPTWKMVKGISTLFRSKILFPVASKAESTALIGSTAAFSVGGCGDAVYSNGRTLSRVKSFIADAEVSSGICESAKSTGPIYSEEIMRKVEQLSAKRTALPYEDDTGYDELLPAAVDFVLGIGQASVSMIQRRLKLGYGRAASLVDQMEEKGIVGPFDGSRPRQLLITKEQWQEMQYKQSLLQDTQEPECNNATVGENLSKPEGPTSYIEEPMSEPLSEAEDITADSEETTNIQNEVPYVETEHGKGHKRRILDFLLGR